jgi:hypothetical protein
MGTFVLSLVFNESRVTPKKRKKKKDGNFSKMLSGKLFMWRKVNWRPFETYEYNVLGLKSYFLRSLLDWVIVDVHNFSSSNLEDLDNFLDFKHF